MRRRWWAVAAACAMGARGTPNASGTWETEEARNVVFIKTGKCASTQGALTTHMVSRWLHRSRERQPGRVSLGSTCRDRSVKDVKQEIRSHGGEPIVLVARVAVAGDLAPAGLDEAFHRRPRRARPRRDVARGVLGVALPARQVRRVVGLVDLLPRAHVREIVRRVQPILVPVVAAPHARADVPIGPVEGTHDAGDGEKEHHSEKNRGWIAVPTKV